MSRLRWSALVMVVLPMSLAGSLRAGEEIRLGDTVVVQSETAALRRGHDVVATVEQGRRLKVLMLKDQWVGTAVVSEGQLVGGWVWKRDVELSRDVAAEPLSSREPARTMALAPNPQPSQPSAGDEWPSQVQLLPPDELKPEADPRGLLWMEPLRNCVQRFQHWLDGSTPSRPPLPAVIPDPLGDPAPPDPAIQAALKPKWGQPDETDLPPARAPRAMAEPREPLPRRVGNRAFELPDFPLPIPRR